MEDQHITEAVGFLRHSRRISSCLQLRFLSFCLVLRWLDRIDCRFYCCCFASCFLLFWSKSFCLGVWRGLFCRDRCPSHQADSTDWAWKSKTFSYSTSHSASSWSRLAAGFLLTASLITTETIHAIIADPGRRALSPHSSSNSATLFFSTCESNAFGLCSGVAGRSHHSIKY